MKESKGKKILEIFQENYEIESAQDLSNAIKDLFKDSLQEMMNAAVDKYTVSESKPIFNILKDSSISYLFF